MAFCVNVARLLPLVSLPARNASLQLDKFSLPGDQAHQKRVLADVCQTLADEGLLRDLGNRREEALRSFGARAETWSRRTQSTLTLHLARAASLENAGLCLHPVYGFVYLPGGGLKGMARAYAETVWLAAQPPEEQGKDWAIIEQVFGWAPGSDVVDKQTGEKPWKPCSARKHAKDEDTAAGQIVFHDAWPTGWPKLTVDIVNCHHKAYYSNRSGSRGGGTPDSANPPGDWENPEPAYFLAVPAGREFSFALTKRRSDVPDDLLSRAREWLDGALTYAGAGAKTAAGYGCFAPPAGDTQSEREITDAVQRTWTNATAIEAHTAAKRDGGVPQFEFSAVVEFLSPAFLGSAESEQLDSSQALRAPSVKGVLRFWWRALRGGWPTAKLRQEEACVFGDTDRGTGLRIAVQTTMLRKLSAGYDAGPGGSPLSYLGYGPIQYERARRSSQAIRDAVDFGSVFELRLTHRNADALNQAVTALWLWGAVGGIGSRTRRGWGSVSICPSAACSWPQPLPQLSDATGPAEYMRLLLGALDQLAPQSVRGSASVEDCSLRWTAIGADSLFVTSQESNLFADWRGALEDLGGRFQWFRHCYGQNSARGGGSGAPGPDYWLTRQGLDKRTIPRPPERTAFGLPHSQEYSSGERVDYWHEVDTERPSVHRDEPQRGRRASPLFFKVLRFADTRFGWLVAFLPSQFIPFGAKVVAYQTKPNRRPDRLGIASPPSPVGYRGGSRGLDKQSDSTVRPDSTLVLDFLGFLRGTPPAWLAAPGPSRATRPGQRRTAHGAAVASHGAIKRSAGTAVRVTILRTRTQGGFFVQEQGKPEGILNLGPIPNPPPQMGEGREVYIHDDARPPQYRWDRPSAKPPPARGRSPRR